MCLLSCPPDNRATEYPPTWILGRVLRRASRRRCAGQSPATQKVCFPYILWKRLHIVKQLAKVDKVRTKAVRLPKDDSVGGRHARVMFARAHDEVYSLTLVCSV